MSDIKRAIALGFFDGVHVGHAALLNKVKERAAEIDAVPSVLTFDVHPDTLVFKADVPLINTAASREAIIKKNFGIDNVVFLHFNKTLMTMDWQEFISDLISSLNIHWIVIGHDFCCGDKGLGTAVKIRDYCTGHGIGCDIIEPVCIDGERVNSTHIRELIADGNIELANKFLGHPHLLTDTVHSGYHFGRQMGTPTINMFFPAETVIPKFGVYATKVYLDNGEVYSAVTNVGVRPTVSDDNKVSVESYLLDYSGNLYGKQVSLEFYKFIRPEIKFADAEELSERIRADSETARAYFIKINAELQ